MPAELLLWVEAQALSAPGQEHSQDRMSRWGAHAWGKYHEAQGEDIVPTGNGRQRGRRRKAPEDAISVDGAHEGIIPMALFNRVRHKLLKAKSYQPKRKAPYPLVVLMYCGHCGKPMWGNFLRTKKGGKVYNYLQYICSTYVNATNPMCGRHAVDPPSCSVG